MPDRMAILNDLKGLQKQSTTHDCPECEKPTYCALDDGKSSSTCWCTTIPPLRSVPTSNHERCLCRNCLTEGVE